MESMQLALVAGFRLPVNAYRILRRNKNMQYYLAARK